MNLMFVILVYITFVVDINGAWLKQPTSINNDAVELTQLSEKSWSLKPAIIMRAEPFIYCQVIDKCCEDEDRVEAVSLMHQRIQHAEEDRFVKLMHMCMNSSTSNKENQKCSSVVQSMISPETLFKDSDVRKYFSLIDHHNKELEHYFDLFPSSCNSEEVHAFTCLSNKKLIKKCVSKVLQNIYNNDYKNYQKTIVNIKKMLIILNQQLSEAFTKNINTE